MVYVENIEHRFAHMCFSLIGLSSLCLILIVVKKSKNYFIRPSYFSTRFHEEFRKSNETVLAHFMLGYNPVISQEHHTCVGLGLSLLDKLRSLDCQFSGLASKLYIASCEEACENIFSYIQQEPEPQAVEKEHVVVVLKLDIADRKGLLLLDPGYHVARVVTVMEDELYPHTGD